jgi:hypothetical protein
MFRDDHIKNIIFIELDFNTKVNTNVKTRRIFWSDYSN